MRTWRHGSGAALSVGAQDDPTCGLVSELPLLAATSAGIVSLVGIQNLTSLTRLDLGGNAITDISALSGLTSLTTLELFGNSITDISAVSRLESLTRLDLGFNPDLIDIQPLLDNTGLGGGDLVFLTSTNVSCTDVAALEAKGVTVLKLRRTLYHFQNRLRLISLFLGIQHTIL